MSEPPFIKKCEKCGQIPQANIVGNGIPVIIKYKCGCPGEKIHTISEEPTETNNDSTTSSYSFTDCYKRKCTVVKKPNNNIAICMTRDSVELDNKMIEQIIEFSKRNE